MRKDLRNWYYYYKWYLVIGLVLAVFFVQWAGNLIGIFEKKPDAQAACICRRPLSAEALEVLENALSRYAADYNGDGTVKVTVHLYLQADGKSIGEGQQSASLAEVSLIGDINDCESYFFLMEDPVSFQVAWQILADRDGSCPEPTDYGVEDKTCRVKSLHLDLSSVSDPAERELLEDLWLGRRCFYTDKTCRHTEDLSVMWDNLIE